ncbi:hypothetical protein [Bosea sp. BK604]|uniref:hypothetical protein n=1 Tax=Bosea sp. BK604 TaxID=2512180 RepID=UPI00104F8198|nr:hypothetical protein [Bosea sp. BK604]TCR63115.1 hypothetical protein EV560_109209 [Bosea sp. BK604]
MNRYGYSIFCDDIRNEVGGKLSFVGCYNAVMFVPQSFPFVLPKFCVHLHILSPAHQPFRSILARCYAPTLSDPIASEPIEAPDEAVQGRIIEEMGTVEKVPRFIVAAASLIFTPLEILAPGLISVRALVDDDPEELKIGSLRVVSK